MSKRGAVRATFAAVIMFVATAAAPAAVAAFRAASHARPIAWQNLKDVEQISRDTLPAASGSEADTQIEPDIAFDPNHPHVIVAVFQQGRFPNGGSVDPGFATSHDGGRTWVTGNLPGLTTAVGGRWDRASDPAVAFGPDGSVYAETLPFNVQTNKETGIAIQRSTDGGLTWGLPVLVQDDVSAKNNNDKNWIAVDTSPTSPHAGRIYAAWDREASGIFGPVPIVLKYSDDHGQTWSPLVTLPGKCSLECIGAVPVVQPNGDLTVIFQSIDHLTTVAQTSTDGGVTWGPQVTVAKFDGADPTGIRSGALPAAAVDPLTGDLYAAWQDLRFRTDGLNDILLSTSTDGGTTWTTPIRVNQDATDSKIDHFTPAVAAYGGSVFVTYRTRDNSAGLSNKVGMAIIVSTDGGATFSGELAMGPPTSLRYAAYVNGDVAEGADVPGIHHPDAPAIQKFLGDYMGLSATATAVQAVWCVASTPPTGETLFQTAWSGTLTSR